MAGVPRRLGELRHGCGEQGRVRPAAVTQALWARFRFLPGTPPGTPVGAEDSPARDCQCPLQPKRV